MTYENESRIQKLAERMSKELPAYVTEGVFDGVYDCGEGNCAWSFSSTVETEYLVFLQALEEKGFQLYTQNTIGKSRFATYLKEGEAVHTAWYHTANECRIVYGPKGYIPSTIPPIYTEVVTPSIAQLARNGVYFTAPGLSLVLQLPDGSFIIVDGGSAEDEDEVALLNYLKNNKPFSDSRPRVTWMFTHAHTDHMMLANSFLSHYADEIELETVCYNFPDFESVKMECEPLDWSIRLVSELKAILAAKYPNTQHYIYHTGNKLLLPGCEIDFLHTHEDFWTRGFRWVNHTCAVWQMTVQGKKLLILGDIMEKQCDFLADTYGDAIRPDILQATHHGYNGGTLKLYQLVDPGICLWPAPTSFITDATVNKHLMKDYNQFLLNNVERHYTADRNTVLVYPDLTSKEF